MKPEDLLPCSQDPATGPHPKPERRKVVGYGAEITHKFQPTTLLTREIGGIYTFKSYPSVPN
jgi:hypothetical protein